MAKSISRFVLPHTFSLVGLFLWLGCFAASAPAQMAPQPDGAPLSPVEQEVARGRDLLAQGDLQSVEVLRTAAQQATSELMQVAGADILTAPPEKIPESGLIFEAARRAAEAHLWWGKAAVYFGKRDEAITALSRAARFAGENRFNTNLTAREALLQLRVALKDGLPLVAPDDTIDTVASLAHFGLWQPRRVHFDFSGVAFSPASTLKRVASSQTPAANDQSADLLITQGTLFPPEPSSPADTRVDKVVVAPLYRNLDRDKLPGVLKLGKMCVGYIKQNDGPSRGLWRQVVRVFFPHPVLTRDNRDDQPRAEALCLQFLKMHALIQAGAGLDNPYARDGVTTLWMSEVSALWPTDDDDPEVLAQLGVLMPKVNTPQERQGPPSEVEWTPYSLPWLAAGQIETSDKMAGEIMFFKVGQARPENEWLREIAHEYGHLWLPAFGGFRPPYEPYGNGTVGETLGMMWAAAIPDPFKISLPQKPTEPPAQTVAAANDAAPTAAGAAPPARELPMREALLNHVERNALPALRFYNSQGPGSNLRRDGSRNGLHYLQGLSVNIERVYGARILGLAARPLLERGADSFEKTERVPTIDAFSLLESLKSALQNPFGSGNTFPIWLPGTVDSPALDLKAADFVARAPWTLKAGSRATCWIYIPPTAKTLHLEFSTRSAAPRIEGGWNSGTTAPTQNGATGHLIVALNGRAGWQRLALVAAGDTTWRAAWFERAAAPK